MAATEPDQPIGMEQFRRYAAGEMFHAEQHTFEKRMLDDPMVAEAYEGFLASEIASKDSHRISAELKNALGRKLNSTKNKVVPLWTYAAAASIVIGIGAYWLVFISENRQFDKPESTAMMQMEPTKIGPADEISSDVQSRSAPSKAAIPDRIKELQSEPKRAVAANSKKAAEDEFEKNARADELEESVADAGPLKTEDFAVAAAPVPAQPPAENTLSAPPATQAFSARKQVAKLRDDNMPSDSAGGVTFSSTDSSAPKPGLTPVPSVSWPAYQSYLKKSISSSEKKGDVTVSFTVNPNGSLSGFSGEGDQKLQEQAIEILKKGPAWKPLMLKGAPVSAPAKLRLQFHSAN